MGSKRTFGWTIILIFLTLIIGFVGGNYFSSNKLGNKLFLSSGNKIDVVLDIIDEDYVDTVNMKSLIENALPKIVSELDPHSSYIPASDMESVNEEMEGHFSGIGVQFTKQNDTIMIVSIITGGPSEKVGLQPGDRIVTIEDSLFVGPNITNEKIMKTLRGPKGTKVNIGIKRASSPDLQAYEIIRGDIPVNTVDVAYQVSNGIGLIKINKFGRTTYDEFVNALAKLINSGCTSLIIDLRDNTGGLLDIAINIANEFLSRGQLIVYTEGKAFPRKEAVANGLGSCQNTPLIILMNEISASASEIVAGSIQDNDRGLILGRPSFGKGLVQNQISLSDGSALRLTIARYYTASGRSIQRNYELGKNEEYEKEFMNRLIYGETKDSTSLNDSHKFYTSIGRPVFENGGIYPDIYIPRDTIGLSSYYTNLASNGILYEYSFNYSDTNREKLKQFNDYNSLWNYLKTQPILEGVVNYAESKGIKRRPTLINISAKLIEKITYAYIARNFFGDDGFYPVYLDGDPAITKAIELINNNETFPQPPKENEEQITSSVFYPTKTQINSSFHLIKDLIV